MNTSSPKITDIFIVDHKDGVLIFGDNEKKLIEELKKTKN